MAEAAKPKPATKAKDQPSAIIAIDLLKKHRACSEQVKRFRKMFGTTAIVTVEAAVAVADQFDWEWAARFLVAPASKAYNEARATASKAYNEARATASKAYDEARATASKAYDEARATAWALGYIATLARAEAA